MDQESEFINSNPESMSDPPGMDDDDAPIVAPERPPMDDEMDITPMIDMTFLLLIFFILTSKMTAEQSYEVPPAKHGSSIAAKNCVVLTVMRGIGEAPIVAKGDGSLFSDDPEQQTAEIAEYVQIQLESGGKTDVLVRAEGNVTAKQLKKVEMAIGEVIGEMEGKMINLAVSEVGK
ncbi:MAG: biopolymer transporter ExbD [Planctomycetes bacterium]|jgi:biopolymer transport protein ExbD|nr:biopolymer transporter ExbD [Planctomycetota bacterium]